MTNDDNTATNGNTSTDDKPDWWDDLADGTREDALVDSTPERHYIRHDGKRYWFDLREPTWQKKSDTTDDALTIKRNERALDTTQYYRDMLEYMVADASIDIKNFNTFLAGANAGLVDKLMDHVPAPGRSTDEDEEGNSEQPSGQEVNEEADGQATQPPRDTSAESSN